MPDAPEQGMVAHYLKIDANERIVYADTMEVGGQPNLSSLVTVEFTRRVRETMMTFTEQAVFGTMQDGDIREDGTAIGFGRLISAMRNYAEPQTLVP